MQLMLNGAPTELAEGATVATIVAARTEQLRRVAVAVNSEVVPRSQWASTPVAEGDSVEVLAAMAGG